MLRNTVSLAVRALFAAFLSLFALTSAWAGPRFQILHTFVGGPTDGVGPVGKVLIDASGDLYGSTYAGGADISGCQSSGCGTVFELTPRNGRWKESILYSFDPSDGSTFANGSSGPLVLDAQGNIYGTDYSGGDPSCNCGFVYQLTQTAGVWTETILHTFVNGPTDGQSPYSGLVEDAVGNLYGATEGGGSNNDNGTLFELSPGANGTWNYSIVYSFGLCCRDAAGPYGPLTMDTAGNIYGTSGGGGLYGSGAAFKLSFSGGTWTDTVLYNFTLDYGSYPQPDGVVLDAEGNLYGTTIFGGAHAVGSVYKLTPAIGFWNQTVLHTFTGGSDGAYPYGGVTIGSSGAIYGTSSYGGSYGWGNVYELAQSNGKWKQTVLHAFTNGSDGADPSFGLTPDRQGNLYGSASAGGTNNGGVMFEITP